MQYMQYTVREGQYMQYTVREGHLKSLLCFFKTATFKMDPTPYATPDAAWVPKNFSLQGEQV